jgi:hypothetical protein
VKNFNELSDKAAKNFQVELDFIENERETDTITKTDRFGERKRQREKERERERERERLPLILVCTDLSFNPVQPSPLLSSPCPTPHPGWLPPQWVHTPRSPAHGDVEDQSNQTGTKYFGTGLPDFSLLKIPKWEKIYKIATKFSLQNIPNGRNIF